MDELFDQGPGSQFSPSKALPVLGNVRHGQLVPVEARIQLSDNSILLFISVLTFLCTDAPSSGYFDIVH